MVQESTTRLAQYGTSRHCIYIRSDLLKDSNFPFKAGQDLKVSIDGKRLIVEAV